MAMRVQSHYYNDYSKSSRGFQRLEAILQMPVSIRMCDLIIPSLKKIHMIVGLQDFIVLR